MASDRSSRLTADQARELFRNLHDEESENSLDECAWVGAQNLKKPADSSDWRQKL